MLLPRTARIPLCDEIFFSCMLQQKTLSKFSWITGNRKQVSIYFIIIFFLSNHMPFLNLFTALFQTHLSRSSLKGPQGLHTKPSGHCLLTAGMVLIEEEPIFSAWVFGKGTKMSPNWLKRNCLTEEELFLLCNKLIRTDISCNHRLREPHILNTLDPKGHWSFEILSVSDDKTCSTKTPASIYCLTISSPVNILSIW